MKKTILLILNNNSNKLKLNNVSKQILAHKILNNINLWECINSIAIQLKDIKKQSNENIGLVNTDDNTAQEMT